METERGKQWSPHEPLPVLLTWPPERPIKKQPQRHHIHRGIERQLCNSTPECRHGQMEPKEQEWDGVVTKLQQSLWHQSHSTADREQENPKYINMAVQCNRQTQTTRFSEHTQLQASRMLTKDWFMASIWRTDNIQVAMTTNSVSSTDSYHNQKTVINNRHGFASIHADNSKL